MRKFNKFYKKFGFVFMLFAEMIFAENIADFSLPSAINLNADRADVAISSKTAGTATTFYSVARPANLSLNSNANFKYTLSINDNTTTFFTNSLSITNAKVEFSGFHTNSFNSNVSVGANSSLTISTSGYKMDANYTEFGGRSKIIFNNRNANLTFGENSQALFTRNLFFISDAQVYVKSGAQIEITSLNAARFQNTFTNDGGNLTFGGYVNGTMITTSVYNIGSPIGTIPNQKNSISTFTQNSGSIVVSGDFYNGGQAYTDISGAALDVFDPAFGGGGDLILNGGTMEVKGKLISQSGGTEIYGGEIINAQNSSKKYFKPSHAPSF